MTRDHRALARALPILVPLLLTGCWFPESQGAPDPPPWQDIDVQPQDRSDVTGEYGGTLSWLEVGEVGTFNPVMGETAMENNIKSLVFDTLAAYDNYQWKYVPGLAWKWDRSEDWLTWTFHLRKGVKFSDGTPLTAADVEFTYRAVTHEKVATSKKASFQVGNAPFPELEVLDDHTVRFTLPVVNALFLGAVSGLDILPAARYGHTLEGDEPTFGEQMVASGDLSTVVGTGPFRVVEYSGAERVVYERNPYYWRIASDGKRMPFVDRVIILMSKDLTSRSVKFLDGGADMITTIPPSDYKQFTHVERDGWFKVHRLGLSLNTNWISFNQHPGEADGKPFVAPHMLRLFQDVRYRRAVSHAIDREKLVRLFVRGKGEGIYSGTNQANKTWHVPEERFPYDRERAAALFAELGLADTDGDGILEDADGNVIRFKMMTNVENPLRVSIIAQIKADLNAVGIDVQLTPMNFQEVVGKLMDGHDWDCILLGWASSVPPDPLGGKNILLSNARLHVWHPMQEKPVNDFEAETDRLVMAMDGQPDPVKRKVLFADLMKHQSGAQPIIYLYSANEYAAVTCRVKNVKASLLRPQTWHNIDELWLDDGWREAAR